MKKLIIAATALAVIGFGGSAAHAQTLPDPEPNPDVSLPLPIECSEQDEGGTDVDGDGIVDDCLEFYVEAGGPTTTTPATTTTLATGSLPRTGSGISPILGIGANSVVVGGIAAVAARRRQTASPTAS